jgi:hypothetical protein
MVCATLSHTLPEDHHALQRLAVISEITDKTWTEMRMAVTYIIMNASNTLTSACERVLLPNSADGNV